MMTATLIAENTLDVQMALTYNFADTNESFTIEIRNGITQLHDKSVTAASVQIDTSRAVLNEILMAGPNAQQVIGKNLQAGKFTFTQGDVKQFGQFMGYFDKALAPKDLMLIVR